MLKLLFVATKWNEKLENFIRSLNKHKFNYKWLGKNIEWKSFNTKSELVYNELLYNNYNDDDIVIVSDAYDVLVNRNSSSFKESFKSFKKPIVVGSEWYCGSSKNCLQLYEYWKLQKYIPPKKYVNAGFIVGYKRELIDLYKYLLNENDDQLGLASYVNKYPELFGVDHSNFIVQHVHVLDTILQEPYFFHFPGPLLKYGLFPQYNNKLKTILFNNGSYIYPNEIIYMFAFIVFGLIIFKFFK